MTVLSGPAVERPRWPAWYAPAGFVVALLVVALFAGLAAALIGVDSDDTPPAFTLSVTLVQDLVLVATAIGFAAMVARPRPAHFGLRPTALKPAIAWTVAAAVSFYAFAAAYAVVVSPDGEQSVVEDLGANSGTPLLIATVLLVVGVAPFAEEFFFRAFFYGALRSRFAVPVAAILNGLLFGAIHYTGPDTLSILPPLAVLGVLFCLLYEKTGSLYPVIAFHAFNNAIALAVQVEGGWPVPLVVGAISIAACLALAREHDELPLPYSDTMSIPHPDSVSTLTKAEGE